MMRFELPRWAWRLLIAAGVLALLLVAEGGEIVTLYAGF